MRFAPKTEKEIAEMNLLPKGEYAFDVIGAEEKTSKKGAQMLVLTLRLYDAGLNTCGRVQDYLLESMPHKLRHAAYGCGIGDHYESGAIEAADFKEATGVVKIGIQQDKTGAYPDKNVVFDYIIPKEGEVKRPNKTDSTSFEAFQSTTQLTDSDIPF